MNVKFYIYVLTLAFCPKATTSTIVKITTFIFFICELTLAFCPKAITSTIVKTTYHHIYTIVPIPSYLYHRIQYFIFAFFRHSLHFMFNSLLHLYFSYFLIAFLHPLGGNNFFHICLFLILFSQSSNIIEFLTFDG